MNSPHSASRKKKILPSLIFSIQLSRVFNLPFFEALLKKKFFEIIEVENFIFAMNIYSSLSFYDEVLSEFFTSSKHTLAKLNGSQSLSARRSQSEKMDKQKENQLRNSTSERDTEKESTESALVTSSSKTYQFDFSLSTYERDIRRFRMFKNVLLVFQDVEFPTNQCVLVIFSNFFEKLFKYDVKGTNIRLDLPVSNPNALRIYLDYIDSFEVLEELLPEMCIELLILIDYLGIEEDLINFVAPLYKKCLEGIEFT